MAKPTTCHSIRERLTAFFAEQTEVSAQDDRCVVTLPFKTLDDRYLSVYVDPKLGEYTLVHDAGDSMAELFAQGVHPTDSQVVLMKAIARRYGATFNGGVFQIACSPGDSLEDAIFALGQCAALSVVELASHRPVVEDEPLSARVSRTLLRWKPDYVDIRTRFKFKGARAAHIFDFVSLARSRGANNVAVKILVPSGSGPLAQAERYGFLALDIEGQDEANWQRLAVVSRADEWTESALALVQQLSNDTIMLDSDNEERVESILPARMTALTQAA